jgi:hypothetical protein
MDWSCSVFGVSDWGHVLYYCKSFKDLPRFHGQIMGKAPMSYERMNR